MKTTIYKASLFLLTITILSLGLSSCKSKSQTASIPTSAKYKNAALPIEERVNDLLSYMTLEEKIAQMAQAANYVASPSDVQSLSIGSILSGGGDHPPKGPETKHWLDFVNSYQKAALNSRLGIPIVYGIDSVHGSAKMLGATVFPHNIGLGAANDPALVEKIGRITSIETAAGGVHWNFSPCVAVARDERWGRTYESFSESPKIVSSLGAAYIRGHENGTISSRDAAATCVKHYFADGGAEWGTSMFGIDRGNSSLSDEELREIHLAPYIAALKENPASIMVSFSGIQGVEMHGNKKWIDILREELGFEGVIISDWAGHKELEGSDKFAQCINAGIDMIMIPEEYRKFLAEVKANVDDKIITEKRIDEAVRRILTMKFKMGLFENPIADESLLTQVGSDEHMEVAREAVRKSLVLLKNENKVLPLSKDEKLAIVGTRSKDLGVLSGGWTMFWGGYSEYESLHQMHEQNSQRVRSQKLFIKGKHILDAFTEVSSTSNIVYSDDGKDIDTAKKAIVVIGELPYVEFSGDSNDLSISTSDIEKIKNAKSEGASVIAVIVSGRPLIISEILPYCDAIVAAWLPGSMAGPGLADVLYGNYNFSGKLSFTWPKSMKQIPINEGDGKIGLYPLGYGLRYME